MDTPAVDAKTDLTQYSNGELFGMLNHLDPYKYPDRVKVVESEIERRAQSGKIPEQLIPSVDLSNLKFWK